MKAPADIYGRHFADHLIRRWQYVEVRQTGSHIILRTATPTVHTISVPAHKPLRKGTFQALLNGVAAAKNVTMADVLHKL